ncbi:hypothetical protein DFA_12205 [Cavenderia fasciculata]|uniref:GIY-YIG domain-containing protein n=1 Tax=Cavenderia fasciculata TaxID=261658 RepID=F4QCK5_CACFS|nr:uncharacterized protein DFA_12205 [Cavenderia fasciculata]EGG14433.1 hypothetical protein DFA_12205 [Cavenderia fasciculata]|eukprot:XP_004353842.1 hypothetical protein DFA_12205 [Cavenderia fasciculata]
MCENGATPEDIKEIIGLFKPDSYLISVDVIDEKYKLTIPRFVLERYKIDQECYQCGLYFHIHSFRDSHVVKYIGETSRFIGTRQHEHFTLKKDKATMKKIEAIFEPGFAVAFNYENDTFKCVEGKTQVLILCLPCDHALARFLESWFLQRFYFEHNSSLADQSKGAIAHNILFSTSKSLVDWVRLDEWQTLVEVSPSEVSTFGQYDRVELAECLLDFDHLVFQYFLAWGWFESIPVLVGGR